MPNSIVKVSPPVVHVGDTVVFHVTVDKSVHHGSNPIRVQYLAYDLQSGDLLAADAQNVDANGDVSFVYGGAASALTVNPVPTHCIADEYFWSYKGGAQKFNGLAQMTFDAEI